MDPGKAISTESLETKGKVHMQVNWYLRGLAYGGLQFSVKYGLRSAEMAGREDNHKERPSQRVCMSFFPALWQEQQAPYILGPVFWVRRAEVTEVR